MTANNKGDESDTKPSARFHQDLVSKAKLSPAVRAVAHVLAVPVLLFVLPFLYALMSMSKDLSQRLIGRVLPFVMARADRSIRRLKRRLLESANGRVLDVGCGGGGWLEHFAEPSVSENITEIVELEPNPYLMPAILDRKRDALQTNPSLKVTPITGFVSSLLAEHKESFDTILLGQVLCEVPNQEEILREIDQLLKPGGKVLFLEHVRANHWATAALQSVLNPIWSVVSDGCNCNRATLRAIEGVPGWSVESARVHEANAPIHVDEMVVGIATKIPAKKSQL